MAEKNYPPPNEQDAARLAKKVTDRSEVRNTKPTDKELRLKKELAHEREHSQHLKRMMMLFATLFGYSFGALIGTIVILCITKI